MELKTLMAFCSKEETRIGITQPWINNGYIYATDGRVLICVRAVDHPEIVEALDPRVSPRNAAKVFNETPLAIKWFPVPDCQPPEDPKEEICDECDGTGERVCSLCDWEGPCVYCHGEGKFTPKRIDHPIIIGELAFSNYYLHLIKKYFPDAEISPTGYQTGARVRFDGGEGLVMPMPRSCRICGCTDARACKGGCSWVEPDLCSRCAADRAALVT